MARCLGLIVGCLSVVALARAQPLIEIHSPAGQVSLIELYTSEGCSSCPPAEAWLRQLKGAPGLWTEFVPVAFHVDYWDHLGWRDPWAARAYSERQCRYARAWEAGVIYTPAFVLNGREWRDWRGNRSGLTRAPGKPGVLTATSTDGVLWVIAFSTDDALAQADAYVALLASGVGSDVKAGENRGRRLAHDFVVATLAQTALTRSGESLKGELTLRRELPSAAHTVLALAVWVTRSGTLEPLQAAGGWLPAQLH